MPFFIKEKSKKKKNNKRAKNVDPGSSKKRKLNKSDDEITTSEDEDPDLNGDIADLTSEEENESPQDKKLRLAKIYLQEIEQIEREKLGKDEEVEKSIISKRLNENYLKEIGKFRSLVAETYTEDKIEKIDTLKCREQRNSITCLCISSNNKFLFTGSKDGIVVKWNIELKKKEKIIPFVKHKSDEVIGHSNRITSIAISFDDKYLAVGDESSDIKIWCPNDLSFLKTFQGHNKKVMGVSFRKNSHTLYSCSADRTVKVWNLDEMTYIETLFGHQDIISSIDSMFKERVITSGSRDGTLRIWKIPEESQLVYNGHSGCIDIVRLINEEHFISGGEDGQINIWSFMKKKPLYTIKDAHGIDSVNQQPNWICSIATLFNTDLFASGSFNGTVKLWKLTSNFRKAELLFDIPQVGYINCMAFTSNGDKLIVSCSRDHRFGRFTFLEGQKFFNCIKVISFLKK
ncbi:U3 small nucleolar RNA-interacting protein 2 [Coccinella septempunctata]|uniref:U3 small nucleolar RNA-interacting protein 2 n=1 Tax=Coccinella septempunctata TaxID=41139 RepID=UPI001D06F1E7|nr:U3 small nucleolar RNA-interacting protein 2 [Coccinella septempunctata]